MSDFYQLVLITEKLADMRATMHQLYGAQYDEQTRPWREILTARCQQTGERMLVAATALAKDSPSGVQQAIILSAALDLMDEADIVKPTPT